MFEALRYVFTRHRKAVKDPQSPPEKIQERGHRPMSLAGWTVYCLGRLLQLLAMWLLLVALFTARPFGPNPQLFGVGIAVFVGGWGLVKFAVGRRA
ncbi:MAG: hypothetical protein HYS05_14745 [Acidobacteria bacterium]|nr:hypothetical protein [Acidobacteriota bacterium]